ncbi:MAG: acyl--CoA ligase [Deltaproteobacteria bacterium]|nr:acyl--CoA ligase [Deltaproteobacteria bacterium]
MEFPASLAARVRELARTRPDQPAYYVEERVLDWAGYDAAADRLARIFLDLGLAPGERVAVWLPDGPAFHIAFQATERAGLVCLGLGARCGERELAHLLGLAGASTFVSAAVMGHVEATEQVEMLRRSGVEIRHHVIIEGDAFLDDAIRVDGGDAELARPEALEGRALTANVDCLFNTTSGTTGLPKIVLHDQLRWFHFHRFAAEVGHLCENDVFMSALPAPFGFGLWTSHFTPTLLGVPTVVLRKFDATAAISAMRRHQVTILAAVSTQFILMLESGGFDDTDSLALKSLFTGGEAVPEKRARAFEEKTGAFVLQFYGSNETGAVSATRPEDPPHKRLTTAGKPIEEMQLRLFDAEGNDVTPSGIGQPAVKGPVVSRGYHGAPEATAELIRPDGWVMLGDLVELDEDGYLKVVGRTDDIIIRGGKNLSAAAIEESVADHPAVSLCAAIGIPDAVFGERAAVYAELRPEMSLTLEELKLFLAQTQIARELWPEALVVLEALPHNVGGKVAKSTLRDDALKRFGEDLDADAASRAHAAARRSDGE